MAMVITNNSPGAGSVAWSGMVINYKGSDYPITNGNSDKKFLWWDLTSPTVLQTSDTLPTMTDDDQIIITNISGTHYLTPTRTKVQAALLTGTMSAFISTPSSAPSADYEVANKKYVDEKRTSTIVSSATPTPNCDTTDIFTVTALTKGATFAVPAGTPVNGQGLVIRIKDNGTARTLAWNAVYREGDTILPTTTVISKTMFLGFMWNSTDSKWELLAFEDNH